MTKWYSTAIVSDRTELNAHADAIVHDFVLVTCRRLIMDKGSQINAHSTLAGRGAVYIGENAVISYGCTLLTSSDSPDAEFMNDIMPMYIRNVKTEDIRLGEGSFIGAHSVIMPGVSIGPRAVVGALSYVDKSVPAGAVGWGRPFQVRWWRKPFKEEKAQE